MHVIGEKSADSTLIPENSFQLTWKFYGKKYLHIALVEKTVCSLEIRGQIYIGIYNPDVNIFPVYTYIYFDL